MSGRRRAVERFLLVATGALILAAPSTAALGGDAADVPALMKKIRLVQRSDFEAWAGFSFARRVVRQRLAEDGAVVRQETLDFEVTPEAGGFDEELTRIDGRPPARTEVEDHRQAGRFAKHYGQVSAGDEVDQRQGFSLGWLTEFPSYRLAGIESVRGVETYRLDFDPAMEGQSGGAASKVPSRFTAAMAGSLWISRRGLHLVRGRARTVSPVRLSLGAIRIVGLDVMLETRPVGEDTWLPERIVVESHLAVLGREIRKRNSFTYSRFRKAEAVAPDG